MGMIQTESAVVGQGLSLSNAAAVRACAECGQPIVRRRRSARQNGALCLSCDQKARRAANFQRYYETHKERILAKNRRWAKDNKDKLVLLRQARHARQPKADDQPRVCIDCGTAVVRAERCRRCYIRFRYATDPEYRTRRLATTRRWLERRQPVVAVKSISARVAAEATAN